MKKIFNRILIAFMLLMLACAPDDDSQAVFTETEHARIFLSPGWQTAFTIKVGTQLTFKPFVSPNNEANYKWTINDEIISETKDLDHAIISDPGIYTLKFEVERFGVISSRTALMTVN
jgi:hypothetical protein